MQVNKFKFMNKCIFCFDDIQDESKRGREHIFPKNIFGFWTSYDICKACTQYLGDNVDHHSNKNPEILAALDSLKIKNNEAIYEDIEFLAEDTIDNRVMKAVYKSGNLKIKPTIKNNFLECSAEDFDGLVKIFLHAKNKSSISEEDFNKEISKIKHIYNNLKPGEEHYSELLKHTIRKRELHKIRLNQNSLEPLKKLIAKISYFYLWYSLTSNQLDSLIELDNLRKYIRYNIDNPPGIFYSPLTRKKEYKCYHRIYTRKSDKYLFIDITLFGFPTWRVVMNTKEKLIFYDNSSDVDNRREIEESMLVLSFEKLDNRKLYVGRKYVDKKQFLYKEIR